MGKGRLYGVDTDRACCVLLCAQAEGTHICLLHSALCTLQILRYFSLDMTGLAQYSICPREAATTIGTSRSQETLLSFLPSCFLSPKRGTRLRHKPSVFPEPTHWMTELGLGPGVWPSWWLPPAQLPLSVGHALMPRGPSETAWLKGKGNCGSLHRVLRHSRTTNLFPSQMRMSGANTARCPHEWLQRCFWQAVGS